MPKSNMTSDTRILYLVNFYGTPPLNFFSKYLLEKTNYKLSVIKLPSVSPSEKGIEYEAFLLNDDGSKEFVRVKLPLKVPPFGVFFLQYIFNAYSAFKLLHGKGVYDLGIGETSFGSFIMRIYKTLGRVKKTVFMSGDALPIFAGKIKPYYLNSENSILQALDKIFVLIQLLMRKIGVKNDVTWYASKKTREWDLQNGIRAKEYFIAPAVTIDKNESYKNLKQEKNTNLMAYIGRLDSNAGVDIVLESLPIIKKEIPDIKIVFVGGSEIAVNKYREIAQNLGIEKCVDFKGFVEKTEDALRIISRAKVGLALYKPDKENVSMYADVSKPKEYLRVGLPVIMSNEGPSLGEELLDIGAGVLVNFDPDSIARACIDILQNDKRYKDLLRGVKTATEKYDYRENFKNIVEKIDKLLDSKK